MGLYDTVLVGCPKCGKTHGFQSKGGKCKMRTYSMGRCPDDVMGDVNRHAPCHCDCGTLFKVDMRTREAVIVGHWGVEPGPVQTGLDKIFEL